jgi:Skp family chaperone for outer membrane proteins
MRRFFVGLAATALLLSARPSEAAEPIPVAVVDMLKCVKSHPAFKKAQADFETKAKAADADREQNIKDLEAMAKDLALFVAKDSPEYLDKMRAYEVRKNTSEFAWKWSAKLAQEEYVRTLIGIYDQVKGLVAKYARDNRIMLVLQMTEERLQAKDPTEFTANVVVRSVPYFDASMDISNKVIATFPPAAPPSGPAPAPAPARAPVPAPMPAQPGNK